MFNKEIFGNPPSKDLIDKVLRQLKAHEDVWSTLPNSSIAPHFYEDKISYTVLINKLPRGDAPIKVREAWIEVIISDCRRVKPSFSSHLVNFVDRKRQELESGAICLIQVNTITALKALIENGTITDYEAADWFLRQPTLSPNLYFRDDEVLILEQKELPANRSYENPRAN